MIRINTKKEDGVLNKNCSREYKQKITPVSTHKYKDVGVTNKYLLYIAIKIRTQKKIITTTGVQDVVGSFVVKLRGLNVWNVFKIQNDL